VEHAALIWALSAHRGGVLPELADKLSVELFLGTHAQGIAYDSLGSPIPNCIPFDDTPNNGPKLVRRGGCVAGAQHQVIVAF
jgi:hypothetical protein